MSETLGVRNPRTGEKDYTITLPSDAELDSIAARLRANQKGWAAAGLAHRIEVMKRWLIEVEKRAPALTEALAADTGRMSETVSEVTGLPNAIKRWTMWAPQALTEYNDKDTSVPFLKLAGQLVPYQLVGVVSPWNFPLLLSNIDAIPALLAGCAVLVKPSEVTPRFIRPLMESIQAVPELAAVYHYVEGDGRIGAAVVDRVDMVCFTGSVATGRKVGAQAASRFIPAFLELGGKDPSIILEGADIDRASSALLWGSTANAGQACQSIERIYVHESLFEPFVEKLVEKANRLKLAYPHFGDGEIGPIIFERQASIIEDHLKDAVEKGAVIRTGGIEKLGGGNYCRPTVLTNVSHDMKVMTEETFGPVLPVMSFKTKEEAVALANDTIYGLSGSVFGRSEAEAMEVARQIQGGGISVQDTTLTGIMQEGEKMSFKMSGIGGSRMGPSAIRRFVRQQLFIINRGANAPDPWWYKAVQ